MATIRADGHEVPLLLPVDGFGIAEVESHLLHVRYGFQESSVYVEEEVYSDSGSLLHSVLICKSKCGDGFKWSLPVGRYRAFGLPLEATATSVGGLTPLSGASNALDNPVPQVKIEHTSPPLSEKHAESDRLHSGPRQGLLSPIVELSSDSEDDLREVHCLGTATSTGLPSETNYNLPFNVLRDNSSGSSIHSRPPIYPIQNQGSSVMPCLAKLASVRGSKNELAHLDFNSIECRQVEFLPTSFNGDVVFELPPCRSSASASSSKNMSGMDKRFDGHTWCRTMTSNIHNDWNLRFRKSSCVGHLACTNPACDYLKRNLKRNETEWSGNTSIPFRLGAIPPKDSTTLCKVCKIPPTCISLCDGRIYYVVGAPHMTRACIHLGVHHHPVANGLCRESMDEITGLISQEIAKTPTAKTSAIALAASKEFLDTFLVHTGDGPKEMLKGKDLDIVMDKFQVLSSPNVRNIVASFRSSGPGVGEIDRLLAMKKQAKIEFIHDSVFPGQGQEKVYLFKMLVDGPGSGVDLVRRMQPGGDLANCWLMFDHVKRVKGWTTIACHVYDSGYCKVMTIAVCDMQSEDTDGQVIMWNCLNKVMEKNGLPNPNFKGFMADSAQANWNAVRIVYGSGDPSVKMIDRERTCLFHWATSLKQHTERLIKRELQAQHIRLCRDYKDAKNLEDAENKYLQIKAWWYSSGAASEESLRELELWLAFWHFRYRQWGGFMETDLSLDELADMPSCNLSETIHNKWLQASGKRGTDLYVATCDDWIRAFMQMTNYRVFLNGGPSGLGPSRSDLKLKRAVASMDGRKITDALCAMPGAKDVCTRVPHLEGEEVFGSMKRKFDIPIGSEGDSHRPDKVNFSHPRVQLKSANVSSMHDVHSNPPMPHVKHVLEIDCDPSEWHIARISVKSRRKCHAIQAGTEMKCKMFIARGAKATAAPLYKGQKREFKGTRVETDEFWFCPDDIHRCVMGPRRSHVLSRPQVPEVWPVLIGTNLTSDEIILFEEAGFRLQERPSMSPRRLFTSSKLFEVLEWTYARPSHADKPPYIRNGKNIRRNEKAPTDDHCNQWESARNVTGTILGVNIIPYPGLGAVITLQSGVEPHHKIYRVTLANFPSCTCLYFSGMASASLGKRGKYVNCKHLYYIFRYLCKVDLRKDKFIHAPSLSMDEVMNLLEKAGMIINKA